MNMRITVLFYSLILAISASCMAMKVPAVTKASAPTTAPDYFFATIKAIKEGNTDRAEKNINNDLSMVNRQDDTGSTFLAYAALVGNKNLVELLIKLGANVNTPDNKMNTPLARAITALNKTEDHDAIIKYLVEKGGIVYAKVTVMFEPSAAYRYNIVSKKLAQGLPEGILYLPESVRSKVVPIDDKDIHMSLVYVAIPVHYSFDEGAAYTDPVKALVEKVVDQIRELKIKRSVFALKDLGDQFKRNTIEIIGAFVVVSYNPALGLKSIIDEMYKKFLAMFPGSAKVYTKEVDKPHMSIARLKRGEKFESGVAIPHGEFLKKSDTEKMLFGSSIDDILIKVGARIPSRLAGEKAIECGGTPVECKNL